MLTLPILSILIALPLLGAFIVSIIQNNKENYSNIKYISILIMVIYAIINVYLLASFNSFSGELQYADKLTLIESINFSYFVGIDALGLLFICILTFSFSIVFIFIPLPKENVKTYTVNLLLMLSGATGLFLTQDSLLFFMFYEASIIPAYFLIGIFGGQNKHKATVKFIIYNVVSSMLMLIAIVYMVSVTKDASIEALYNANYLSVASYWLFIALFTAFAVKSGLVPFNTWVPTTYNNAPIGLNIILSAVVAKYGFYGIIKILIPALPQITKDYNYVIFIISGVSVFYGILIALRSTNIKKLIAYMSISHVALLIAIPFSGNLFAIQGSILQVVSHSLYNIGFFVMLAILHKRHNSNNIVDFNNLASAMPKLSAFIVLIGLAAMAFPLTSTFVSELLMLLSVFLENRIYGVVFTIAILFNAVVIVVLYKKLLYNNTNNGINLYKTTITENISLVIIAFAILLLGVQPNLVLEFVQHYAVLLSESLNPSIPSFLEINNN